MELPLEWILQQGEEISDFRSQISDLLRKCRLLWEPLYLCASVVMNQLDHQEAPRYIRDSQRKQLPRSQPRYKLAALLIERRLTT